MADKPKKPSEEPETKAKRRIVRDPETFRERAIKASVQGDKPTRKSRVRSAGGKVVSPVTKPIGSAAKTVSTQKGFKPVRVFFRILGKILVPPYFRNSWKELRQVTWLGWRQSLRLTWAVLIFAIIFGMIVALVDYGLDKLFKDILLK